MGLYDNPVGALDPRSMALMQMGLGLMGSSGPSMTPNQLGPSLGKAGMQGVQAFQQAQEMQQQEAFRKLQAQRMEEQMRLEREKAMRPPSLMSGGPGTVFFDPATRQPIFTVPQKPEAPQEPKAPMTRKVRIGEDEVTQEYVGGKWQEVGRGPAFARSVAPAGSAAGGPVLPKPPTGYRYKEGSDQLEPIPGGPKDTSGKDAARAQGAVQKADTVIQKVDEALGQTGFFSTGLTGSVMGALPGTKAYDLDKTLDTIKANLGFSELQAMREASPTGGALGQVAIQELAMLQSTVASLDKGQSRENLERGLTQVKKHFENWKNAVLQAQGQGQDAASPTPAASRPTKGQVIDGYEFIGGDPGNRMNWKKAK
jgi:hypothetical protein